MEELCEKLGADYSWDPETKTATGVYRDVTLRLTAGSGTAEIDEMSTPIQEYTHSYQAIQNGDTVAVHPVFLRRRGRSTSPRTIYGRLTTWTVSLLPRRSGWIGLSFPDRAARCAAPTEWPGAARLGGRAYVGWNFRGGAVWDPPLRFKTDRPHNQDHSPHPSRLRRATFP